MGKERQPTLFWVTARPQICVLQSVSNCFRGSRSLWKGGIVEDGVGIPKFEE